MELLHDHEHPTNIIQKKEDSEKNNIREQKTHDTEEDTKRAKKNKARENAHLSGTIQTFFHNNSNS